MLHYNCPLPFVFSIVLCVCWGPGLRFKVFQDVFGCFWIFLHALTLGFESLRVSSHLRTFITTWMGMFGHDMHKCSHLLTNTRLLCCVGKDSERWSYILEGHASVKIMLKAHIVSFPHVPTFPCQINSLSTTSRDQEKPGSHQAKVQPSSKQTQSSQGAGVTKLG